MPTDITPKYPTTSTDGSAENKADTKTEKKFDRFHPEMPAIPGVNVNNVVRPPANFQQNPSGVNVQKLVRIGGAIAAIVVVAIAIPWWIKRTLRTPIETLPVASVEETPVPDLPALPAVAQNREDPGIAATTEELSKPWSSKKFTFVKPLTQETVDAMVIRLPGGGLWAFALLEPNRRCNLEFVTDLSEIQKKYDYRATHPMMVSPCDGTVYDPLKLGPLGGNTWVRGEVVQGLGLRPPISIDVKVHGHSIIADGIE